jgi:hypothetical protein
LSFVRAWVTALGAVSQPLLSVAATAERVVIVVPLHRVLGFSPLAAAAAPLLLTIVMLLPPARARRLGQRVAGHRPQEKELSPGVTAQLRPSLRPRRQAARRCHSARYR